MDTKLKHRWSVGNNYLAGITAGDWWRLLSENRFAIAPAYWHRAAFITLTSLVNSYNWRREQRRYGQAIDQVQITHPPLFILGHWRSGTTLLHYLLAQDKSQFNFANTFQVVNPKTFLTTEDVITRRFAALVPATRPMDNMTLSFATPQEDEFAPLLLTFRSLYLGISFPRRINDYSQYLTFRGVPEPQVKQWQQALVWFCKKLTLNNNNALLLKSPAHTARLRLILEMFPDARFVHIHRDPYRVFQSQRHYFDTAVWYTYLQKPDLTTIDDGILGRYQTMYDAFFEDLPLVPEGQFCELSFDALEKDPVDEIRKIYEKLSLPGFATFKSTLSSYVDSLAGYRKNQYATLDEPSRRRVAKRWAPKFRKMGLPRMTTDTIQRRIPSRRAPGPSGGILWGCLKEFQRDAIGFLADAVRQHGDIVRFRFGPVVVHLVNRPEYVEQVFARGSQRYDKNTRSVSKIRATCGNSLLSSDGDSWFRHRRLIQPVFQPRFLESFATTIDSSTARMLESWGESARADQAIDVVSEMMRLTMTIAAGILFASDVQEETQTIEQSLGIILEDTWRRLETPLDMSVVSPLFHRQKFRQAINEIDRVVYRIIDERRRGSVLKDDLLSRLLTAHQAENGTRLSDLELRDAVVTLLLAGHETTANALAWTFYLVSQAPPVEARLCHEAAAGETAANTADFLAEARMVFFEAIRLYPSIWIIERRAVAADTIGGFSIPRGSTVIISPYLLHRHPEFWQSPETFDPARFTAERISARPRHAYIPFGVGPHKCIGEHMASLVATRILTMVFRRFRLQLVADQTVKPQPGITLRHTNELRMTLHRIDQERRKLPPTPTMEVQ